MSDKLKLYLHVQIYSIKRKKVTKKPKNYLNRENQKKRAKKTEP